MRKWLLLLGFLAVTVMAACELWPLGPTTIDGHKVGARACRGGEDEPLGEPMCGQFTAFARTQLDNEQPGHAAIRDIEVYLDGARFKNGGVYGYWVVVVARLADGTAAAYPMHCYVVSPEDGCSPELTESPSPS
jgi:hypothetical protein